jgi:hypothetical protein
MNTVRMISLLILSHVEEKNLPKIFFTEYSDKISHLIFICKQNYGDNLNNVRRGANINSKHKNGVSERLN